MNAMTFARFACVLASALLLACGHAGTGREPDEYIGCTADEQWTTFDDSEPSATVDATQAPVLQMPAGGGPFAQKPLFSWLSQPGTPFQAAGDVPHDGPGCTDCCPQWNTGAISTLHLPPISGNAYDLQLSSGGKVVWRVLTTLQEWLPTDAAWAAWKGQTLELRIWRLDLLRNDPKDGPYTSGTPFVFTVGG